MKYIGIIGAGAAGLCAAKNVLAHKGLVPIVWERATSCGGTWQYSSDSGVDKNGYPIHSSMYESLRTDIPKEIMGFLDYPFPEDGPSYVNHSVVLRYLQSYAETFKLEEYIKFEHNVELVEPMKDGDVNWTVKVKDLNNGTTSSVSCDAVIVCNGHFSVPKLPNIPGIDDFKGLSMHSHYYRNPSKFNHLNVIVLGMGISGMDISLELATVAKKVYISHNLPDLLPSNLPDNVQQVKGIAEITADGFSLFDGSLIEADAIIYCTGYKYTFPFLSPACNVNVTDDHVTPLYKHIIHIQFPTLAFIGIPSQVVCFPLHDFQARYFIATLSDLSLPCSTTMINESKEDFQLAQLKGIPPRHYHRLRERQWSYLEELANAANFASLPPFVKEAVDKTVDNIIFDLKYFKEYQCKIDSNGKVSLLRK